MIADAEAVRSLPEGTRTIVHHETVATELAKIRLTLFIHQRCGRLIETLPALQHDPHRPEDVLKVDADEDGVGGDDAADALRYLVATKSREVRVRKLRGV